MRILLTSDTHLGMTKIGNIEDVLRAHKNIDLVVHSGDYCGGRVGYRAVRTTCALMRKVFPNTPILSVLGNHDYWGAENEAKYLDNMKKIGDTFASNDIHWLDQDGCYIADEGILFAGHTGWYSRTDIINGYVNDRNFMPNFMQGKHLHQAMLDMAREEADDIMEQASLIQANKKIWVSHFPVIEPHLLYGGDANLGFRLQENGFTCFLEGHSHIIKNGPDVFNSGSDYGTPRSIVVEL